MEPSYDVTNVPGVSSSTLSSRATDRPDAGVADAVTDTSAVTTTPQYTEQQSTPVRMPDRYALAREVLYEVAEQAAWQTLGRDTPSVVEELAREWAALIEDTLTSVYGDDHWLYAIGVDMLSLQDPADVAKQRIKDYILGNVNLAEAEEMRRITTSISEEELRDRHEDEDDVIPFPKDELMAIVEESHKAATDKLWLRSGPTTGVPIESQATRAVFPPPWWPASQFAAASALAASPPHGSIASNIYIGRAVHEIIQQHYLATRPGGIIVMERVVYGRDRRRIDTLRPLTKRAFPIKELGFLDFGLETVAWAAKKMKYVRARLRPDVVDFRLPYGEIYEIKSRRSAPWAVLQVYGYLYAYQAVDVADKIPLIAGLTYIPPSNFPVGRDYVIRTYRPLPGLMLYDVYKLNRRTRKAMEKVGSDALHRALLLLLGIIAALLGLRLLPGAGGSLQPSPAGVPPFLIDPLTGQPTPGMARSAALSALAQA